MAPIVVPDVESHYAKTNVGRGGTSGKSFTIYEEKTVCVSV
jgi:hypothetical protein